MKIVTSFVFRIVKQKITEKSTWLGVIAFVGGACGYQIDPLIGEALAGVLLSLSSFALVCVDEEKPHAPAPAVPPAVPDRSVVQLPGSSPANAGVHVQTQSRADLPPDQRGNDLVAPHPVRPGFNSLDS